MSAPILSILVPTLACRDTLYARLERALLPQLSDAGVILKLRDDGEQTIGAKRQRLLERADTPYVAFFDDDDLPSERYGAKVLAALKGEPDVIGFRLLQFDDGEPSAKAIHSVRAGRWHTDVATGLHWRTPNHLNPVRREMALAVGYRDLNNGEDADYSERLFARFPQMRETFIDDDLYLYLRRTNRTGERCNTRP